MSEIRNQILLGDVRERLAEIPDASVDCVITSPPYFRLRDYGRGGQLGLESSIDQWADVLRDVLRGVARVLKPGGSVWLILGDTYSRDDRHGAPKKSLLLGPERLGLRLLEDGWIVRNKVTWAKTNPMPTSARDRLSNNT
jgi:site-specific DNA-methyltransferase (adenine-specific)